jgi:hypothetical protein
MKPRLLYALEQNFFPSPLGMGIIRKVNTYCSIEDPDPVGTETFSRPWIWAATDRHEFYIKLR